MDTDKEIPINTNLDNEVPFLDEDDVFGQVEDYWQDFWSNYL